MPLILKLALLLICLPALAYGQDAPDDPEPDTVGTLAPEEQAPDLSAEAQAKLKAALTEKASKTTVSPLGKDMSMEEVAGCKTDADCAISCRRDGLCCPQLCGCSAVYNKAFVKKLEAHQAGCATDHCPEAQCEAPSRKAVARCEKALCVVRWARP